MLCAELEAKRRKVRIYSFVLNETSEGDNYSAEVQRSPRGHEKKVV